MIVRRVGQPHCCGARSNSDHSSGCARNITKYNAMQGRIFREAFIQKLALLLRGTVAAPPERFGETLADEHIRGGACSALLIKFDCIILRSSAACPRAKGAAWSTTIDASVRCWLTQLKAQPKEEGARSPPTFEQVFAHGRGVRGAGRQGAAGGGVAAQRAHAAVRRRAVPPRHGGVPHLRRRARVPGHQVGCCSSQSASLRVTSLESPGRL